MIKTFNYLGEYFLLNKNEDERKKEFLLSQLITPKDISLQKHPKTKILENEYRREIIINLDTETQKIEIKLGDELDKARKEEEKQLAIKKI